MLNFIIPIIAGMSNLQKYSASRKNHNTFRSPQNKGYVETKVPSFLRMTTSPQAINSQYNFDNSPNPLKSTNREFLRRTVDVTGQKSTRNGFEYLKQKQQFCTGQNYNKIVQQQSGKLEMKQNVNNKPPIFLNKKEKNLSCMKNNSLHSFEKEPEDYRRLIIKKVDSQTENSQQEPYTEKIRNTIQKIPSFLKKSKQPQFSTPIRKKQTDSCYPIQSAHQFHLKHQDSLVTTNSSVFSIGDQETHELTIQQFKILKKLGQGRFGNVFLAVHAQTNWLTAIKIIKKAMIQQHNLEKQFVLETKLQCYFNHPNIVKLYGVFDDKENVYLLIQYMESGTLYEHLKKTKKLPQLVVRERMAQTLRAIQCLHNQNVAHRDIKPQNIVLSYDICKICDFGWATICDQRRKTLCGTIDYACPQILQGRQYGLSIDLWCLGVLCYELLTGKAPFYHMSKKKTMQNIINADKQEVKFPEGISAQARDMITNLIVKDPNDRLTASQVLKHPFITKKSMVGN